MIVGYFSVSECTYCDDVTDRLFTKVRSTSYGTSTPFDRRTHNYRPVFLLLPNAAVELNNNNNNNQYIYKQRQSHAMSQRRWLATAVIFRPSDVSLGFAET